MEFRDGKFYQNQEAEVDINYQIERAKSIQGQVDLLVAELEGIQVVINEAMSLVETV